MTRAKPSNALLASAVATMLLLTLPAGAAATGSDTKLYTGTIAFLREPPGGRYTTNQSLYVIHADGSGLQRVTPPSTPVFTYQWSPSNRLIAYIDAHTGSLWSVRPDGTGLRQLVSGSNLASQDLSWAPTGKEIAILSAGPEKKGSLTGCSGMRVYIVHLSDLHVRKLRTAAAWCGGIAWSPRGDEIAYEGDVNAHAGVGVWVIHPDGSGRRHISRRGGFWVTWSPDGRQIAFGVRVGYVTGLGLYRGVAVADADGRHFHLVTRNADNEYPAAWSPRGPVILYGRANYKGIDVIGANGRNDHRVTSDSPPGSEWPALAWSPNGRAIVYATPTGNGNLYETGADGRGKVELTSTPDEDLAPSWVTP